MSNPGEFFKACSEGRIWLHCNQCNETKQYNDVKHLDSIENPTYLGPDPWWYDTKVFVCPDCGTTQQSVMHIQD